ncbi:hypothetical protein [Lusitaniella coriacea]|uniref:hypothetical protein n=1 Tax=Lusitaniella coriacea TaxID=1983105 RepID=UPI003CF2DA76
MNSENKIKQTQIENTSEDATIAEPRTVMTIITQTLGGAVAGLLVSICLIAIYRWIWNVDISLRDATFLSLGFCLYCGILSAWLGKRFWNLLGTFLEKISV